MAKDLLAGIRIAPILGWTRGISLAPGSHCLQQVSRKAAWKSCRGRRSLACRPLTIIAMSEGNMLASRQRAIYDIDESKAIPMPLRPGEMSLHHVNLLHCSRPNNGAERRVSPVVRQGFVRR
jgi:ectoine hydroxylase-related dioxygenase (phytanoyl-CoA dioxygenase family)